MATATGAAHDFDVGMGSENLVIGGLSGLLAGGVFGGIMSHTPMMENVAALFTVDAVAAGWILHFGISIAFGVLFAAIVAFGPLPEFARRASTGAAIGIGYGIVVWLLGAAILMPLWMGAVAPVDPPVPSFNWMSFAGHIAFGAVLGAIYPVLLANN